MLVMPSELTLGKQSGWRCMCLCISQFTCAIDQEADKQQPAIVQNNRRLSDVAYFIRGKHKYMTGIQELKK